MSASAVGLNPLPPHLHHSTTRLTHRQAHTMLASFLDRAENDAAYRPDSTLTERGPQALSSSSTPNLTLTHLKRILKGIEGERVGGGLKVLDEDADADADANGTANEVGGSDGTVDVDVGDTEGEGTTRGVKRSLAFDQEDAAPKRQKQGRKQKQRQDIIALPDAERTGDPTDGAVLEARNAADDESEWQDPTLYALGRHEVNHNDAPTGQGRVKDDARDGVFAGGGQNDAGGEDELDLVELDARNEIEEARHPGAGLKQPSGPEEERQLVSIRIEGTGEVVDPRENAEKKGKRAKPAKNAGHIDGAELVRQTRNVERDDKKRKGKKEKANDAGASQEQDRDRDHDEDGAVDVDMADSQRNKVSKHAEDKEATSQALSKEEKKKLKKMRHKDAKRDREDQRLKKKTK
ncbi:hypothetical protein A1O7_01796 [Cladophialophora yegresii CBS 114405]|uniref:Uncharacterized protein n=1 Tax=Cladophialophora yegresii CBS 114405 TaxID=1182544 RepID=W9WKD6_9EURO|nr:uncharacterized protein A1O7_01796 [Cladophialophora yegresii CBS 114405]EXJ65455.1 hypothetical protein A1O7_01796 [Cladophialophora yegresii CBS 114405]